MTLGKRNQFCFAVIVATFFASSLYGESTPTHTGKVDHSLARAYQAAQNDQTNVALDEFTRAGELAKEIKDWQGLVDAGYGLAALGDPNKAKKLFDQAFRSANNERSWQGLVAAGYALSSLPKEMGLLSKAKKAFLSAKKQSVKQVDWRGLVESAQGLQLVDEPEKANEALELALELVQESQDAEGASAVSQAFTKLGNSAKAAQAQALTNDISRARGGDTRVVKKPPSGWSSFGKSVRDADEVSVEAQRLNRASADKDIANKMEYIKQQEQIKLEEKKYRAQLAEAYLYYSGYYGYPGNSFGIDDFGLFGFGIHPLTRSHLHSWAAFHLSRFDRHGSFFVRVGRDRHHNRRHHY